MGIHGLFVFFFGLSCSMELVKKKENENEISVMTRWVFGLSEYVEEDYDKNMRNVAWR